jgi:hypothetical protein
MTKDEALKLALETLEQIQEGCNNVIADKLHSDAVDLAKLVRKDCNKPIDAIRKTLSQPEQEPVTLKVNGIPPFKNPPGDVIDSAFHVSDWAHRNNWKNWRIGYCCSVDFTTTPKREWVGLTDEEKRDCYLRIDVWSRCYEMVEAKLREKNT